MSSHKNLLLSGSQECVCNPILVMTFPNGTMAAHTLCNVSVHVMFVVCLHAHVQLCRFDKEDATADIQ